MFMKHFYVEHVFFVFPIQTQRGRWLYGSSQNKLSDVEINYLWIQFECLLSFNKRQNYLPPTSMSLKLYFLLLENTYQSFEKKFQMSPNLTISMIFTNSLIPSQVNCIGTICIHSTFVIALCNRFIDSSLKFTMTIEDWKLSFLFYLDFLVVGKTFFRKQRFNLDVAKVGDFWWAVCDGQRKLLSLSMLPNTGTVNSG